MPVTFNPSDVVNSILEAHFPSPEQKQQFDQHMTELKALRYRGQLGTTPEEQRDNTLRYFREVYPQVMQGVKGSIPGIESNQMGEEFAQWLADQRIVEQPKTVGQEYVYPALAGGAEAAGAVGGAMLGGSVGGIPGAMAGAGIGGAATQAVANPLLRSAFDLPQESTGQQLQNAAVSAGVNTIMEGLGTVGMAAKAAGKKWLFFGSNPRVTGDVLDQLRLIEEGGQLAGNNAFPTLTAIKRAEREGTETLPTFRDSFRNMVNTSLGGSTYVEKMNTKVQQALNALSTDFVRQLGADGAVVNSAEAAKTITLIHGNRYQLSRTVRRELYDAASQYPGSTNPLPSSPIKQIFSNTEHRIDLAQLASDVERRTDIVNKGIDDYLTRQAPVNANTPIGTPLPDYDPTGALGQPGSATFQGFLPSGEARVRIITPHGPLEIPENPANLVISQDITDYRSLRELRSVLVQYAREMNERASQAGTEVMQRRYRVMARDANYTISQLNDVVEQAASQGHMPRETLMAYQLADKFAREEVNTFENHLIGKILARFDDEPQSFARELLRPENAETLKAIQKAMDATPDVPVRPQAGVTTQADLTRELGRPTLYGKALMGNGKSVWEGKIRPQLQAEYLQRALESQSGKAFEDALTTGATQVGHSLQGVHPDTMVAVNGKKLLTQLEDTTLDPETRHAIFGNEQTYRRWITFAKTLANFDMKQSAPRAGIGSFMSVSRQSAGITMMGYAGLQALQGKEPNTGLALFGGVLLAAPPVLAMYLNNPKHYQALITGLKQTPDNFIKSRIARSLAADSLEQVKMERDRAYPVLSGEPVSR